MTPTGKDAYAYAHDDTTEVRAAKQDRRQAADFLAALEERVRAGDPDVKPGELREARGLVEYAVLRVDAAKRRAEQATIDARHTRYQQVGAAARGLVIDDAPVVSAFNAAVAALRDLYTAAAADQQRLMALVPEVSVTLEEAAEHDETGLLQAAGLARSATSDSRARFSVTSPDGSRRLMWSVSPISAVVAVLDSVVAGDPDMVQALGWEHGEAAQASRAAGLHLTRAYPQLAPGEAPAVEPAPDEPVATYRIEAFRTGHDGHGTYRDPISEVIAGVRFSGGYATLTTDTGEARRALAYFRRKGYTIVTVPAPATFSKG